MPASSSGVSDDRDSREPRALVREPDFRLRYSQKDLQDGHMFRSACHSTAMITILLVSFVAASLWIGKGINWIYDSGTGKVPLLSCPSFVSHDTFRDADYCKITLSPWSMETFQAILINARYALTDTDAKAAGLCVIPFVDPEEDPFNSDQPAITCYSRNPCYDTTDWYPVNPYSASSINDHSTKTGCSLIIENMLFRVQCFEIYNAVSYCDEGFNVEPVVVLAIRGVLLGLIILYLMMLGYDGVLAIRVNALTRKIIVYKQNVLSLTIPESRKELMQRCLLRWNSLMSRTNSGLSYHSQPVTPSSSSSPRQAVALPFQPVLSPRTSIRFKTKDSPVGYSPRMDSPPVHVISTINKSASRLTRAHGAVEVLFATSWRKRVSAYFKLREKTLKKLRLRPTRRILHILACVLWYLCLFVLLFRFVMWISAELPLSRRLPGSLTLLEVIQMGSDDRMGSVGLVLAEDITANNLIHQRVVYMWVSFIAYLDVILETATLLVLSFMAMLRPTNLKASRSVEKLSTHRGVSGDDLHPHAATAIKPLEDTRIDTTGFSSQRSEDMDESPVSVTGIRLPAQFIPRSRRQSLTSTSLGGLVDPSVDDPATCVLISVMSPCATADGRKIFMEQLQSLRNLVENDRDIFVVDCGLARSPIDDTESVIYDEISDKIHYVYFPEPNRLVSLYWTSKYWIPFLFTSHLCGDYIYSMILEGESGVVFPPDFKLPSSDFLLSNPGIKAMYVPVNELPSLIDWPSRLRERIHLLWLSNVLRSSTHAGGYCVPQIWERNSFEMTCFNLPAATNSDPSIYRSLCLKANGRMLLSDRSKSRMIHWLPRNGAQPHIRTRSVGWTGQRSDTGFLSNVGELLDLPSLLHGVSVLSKSAILGEIVNTIFDSFRLFLLVALLIRDPVGLCAVALVVGVASVLPLLINILLSVRFEDHLVGKSFFLILLQPLSLLLLELPRRVVRLFKLKIIPTIYRIYESDVSIGEREEQIRDLPIVPPHPVPHWPTVWL